MLQILVMLSCVYITHSTELEDDRKKWFHRIKKYELIHVNLDTFASSHIIEFDAFNNHYKVQLRVNEHVVPIILLPNKDGTTTEQHPTDDALCYYHGKVLNEDSSRVAVSACEGEGIRGRIHAFGFKLFINPTNYYLSPYDDTALSDEHLVYKSSDYDWEEERKDCGPLEAVEIPLSEQFIPRHSNTSTRRRLASAGTVELVTAIDDSWVDNLGGVSKSVSYFKGVVNDASELYTDNNLPSNVAPSIKYRYAIFDSVTSCSTRDDCLAKSKSYLSKYDSKYDFDYGFLYTRASQGGGKSWVGAACSSKNKYGTSLSKSGRSTLSTTLAHELGHALMKSSGGSTHDSSGSYIMDSYGSGDTWSSKSVDQLERYKDKGGWDCLKSSGSSGSVSNGNYEDRLGNSGGSGGGSAPDEDRDDDDDDDRGSSGSGGCIKLSNFPSGLSKLNGYWSKSGSKYNQDKSSKYLSRVKDSGKYYWAVNGDWDYGWCSRTDILSCGGEWDSEDHDGVGSFRKASSCKNSFTIPKCFDDYENAMCFYSNSSSDGQVYELVEDEGCYNDAPVWRFIDDDMDHMFYLHFNYDAEWVITDGFMPDYGGDFRCSKENLYECTDGNWMQEVTYDLDEVALNVVDGVRIEGCGFASESVEAKSSTGSVLIVILIVLVIALVVCGVFLFYQHHSKEKVKMVEIGDESEDETQEITVTTI